ncbi:MAG TPA: hypothetical protein PLV12_08990 [Saprospiraceae bacterium]|nr:hypothetical protein [Saprospiraceae bacterium]
MKKVLIVYKIYSDEESTKGILRKMLEQARSLERLGASVDMVNLHSKGVQVDGKLFVLKSLHTPGARHRFEMFDFFANLKTLPKLETYDVVYIRYSPLALGLLGLLKHLKKINPKVKIFLDLATYPYIHEYKGLKKLVAQVISYRHKYLKKFIHRIITVGSDSNIWGIPVVAIKNAIDPESYKLKNSVSVPGVIRLILVSTFWHWHGIDRLINGLIHYMANNPKYTVYLTLIGEGAELSKIRELADHPTVKENIFFFPSAYGGELNQFFDQADIAIGTLAVDRINLTECSALKHREYGARGIPFVYAGSDKSFDDKDFVLSLPLAEKDVDFTLIEKFYERLTAQPAQFTPTAIKERVNKDLSWESQLGFILE